MPDHAPRQFIPPAPLFPLIGRADELRRLSQLAADPTVRLMTITGPGGVGKTRLALQTAWNLRAEFASGVAFVPLAGVSTPDSAIAAMAQFFGIGDVDRAHLGARLRGFLQHRRLLLVLDNLEHVLPIGVEIAGLLEAAPDVTVMATSRVLLNVEGERRFELAPLSTPTVAGDADLTELASSPAVQLFVARAAAIAPGFTLTEANGAVVSQICRLLDGLPLAIELAARRIRALAPDTLLVRLQHSLAELTGGEQTKPGRHQTMRAAIAWSCDLLRPDHQALFRRLAVFSGGFTLDGVEAVALDDPATASSRARLVDDLAALTDASLIHHALGDDDDRFEMLETIRRFGLDRLTASGDEPAVRRRHAAWMLSLAEAGDVGFLGSAADHRFWIRLFQRERANFIAALSWAVDGRHTDIALRLSGQLWNSWHADGSGRDGRLWLTRALAMPDGSQEDRAIALEGFGPLASSAGDVAGATAAFEEAIALRRSLGNANALARAMQMLGIHWQESGEPAQAHRLISEAMATYGVGLNSLQERWRDIGHAQLGLITALSGDAQAGLAMCEAALDLSRKNDSLLAIFVSTVFLGVIKLMLGSVDEARELAQESVRLMWTTGDVGYNLFGALRSWALVESMNSNQANLVRLSGAIDAGMGDRAIVGNQHFDILYHRANAAARLALGDLRADEEFARGLQMTLEETVAMVLEPPHATDAAEERADGANAGAHETNLTKRERDVLRLLVKRFTDAEIADELFISKRTVGSHVRNVCTKLGVKNRRAAAAIAVRDHLV